MGERLIKTRTNKRLNITEKMEKNVISYFPKYHSKYNVEISPPKKIDYAQRQNIKTISL